MASGHLSLEEASSRRRFSRPVKRPEAPSASAHSVQNVLSVL